MMSLPILDGEDFPVLLGGVNCTTAKYRVYAKDAHKRDIGALVQLAATILSGDDKTGHATLMDNGTVAVVRMH